MSRELPHGFLKIHKCDEEVMNKLIPMLFTALDQYQEKYGNLHLLDALMASLNVIRYLVDDITENFSNELEKQAFRQLVIDTVTSFLKNADSNRDDPSQN